MDILNNTELLPSERSPLIHSRIITNIYGTEYREYERMQFQMAIEIRFDVYLLFKKKNN